MAELVDELLRYGLFLGAIFQLVCIAAVVFVPPKEEGKDVGDSSDEDGPVGEGTVVTHRPPQHTTGGWTPQPPGPQEEALKLQSSVQCLWM
ncbi:hypothetical protein MRX96_054147 [Rhipicephalus microplus]